MDVRNCKSCGRLFNYLGGRQFCPECMKKLDDKFEIVKAYIYDNPGSNIDIVAKDNDVSTQQIRQWVREEKLQFSDASLVGLSCEKCGVMIKTGRFCPKCKDELAKTIGGLYHATEPDVKKNFSDGKNRMRFLNQDN
jgi:predicted amidophosphoribosyltransferase